jgi:SHS2 domain-containing protein
MTGRARGHAESIQRIGGPIPVLPAPSPADAPAAGYQLLDHTADVGLRAWGSTPAAAFAQAARGMFAIMRGAELDAKPGPEPRTNLAIEVAGADWSELLVNWLAELLFYHQAQGFIPEGTSFEACAPPHCRALLVGRQQEASEEAGGLAIKGVTYHQLEVDVGEERTEIRVIFDV